jgi:hypothetical protein
MWKGEGMGGATGKSRQGFGRGTSFKVQHDTQATRLVRCIDGSCGWLGAGLIRADPKQRIDHCTQQDAAAATPLPTRQLSSLKWFSVAAWGLNKPFDVLKCLQAEGQARI